MIRNSLYSNKFMHEHFTKKGSKRWKAKLKFETKEQADYYIKKHNLKMMSYLCSYCNNWHIGHKHD